MRLKMYSTFEAHAFVCLPVCSQDRARTWDQDSQSGAQGIKLWLDAMLQPLDLLECVIVVQTQKINKVLWESACLT